MSVTLITEKPNCTKQLLPRTGSACDVSGWFKFPDIFPDSLAVVFFGAVAVVVVVVVVVEGVVVGGLASVVVVAVVDVVVARMPASAEMRPGPNVIKLFTSVIYECS